MEDVREEDAEVAECGSVDDDSVFACPGVGIRAICRELSVSRKAVRRALRTEGVPRYQRPQRQIPKLEPFEARIQELYFRDHLIGSRIVREVRGAGYSGSASALHAYGAYCPGVASPSRKRLELLAETKGVQVVSPNLLGSPDQVEEIVGDVDESPGQHVCPPRCQEHGELRGSLRRDHRRVGHVSQPLLSGSRLVHVVHQGPPQAGAGTHRENADTVLPGRRGEAVGQTQESRLSARVVRKVGRGFDGHVAGHVDDPTPPTSDHAGQSA